ncbi:MAG: RodZ domain-containing protein [Burkholderiales bacterium]
MTNDEMSPGPVLRAEREKRGLKVEEVASQMRLSRHQVEALERGDYDALPGTIFVRGFIRNYAKLLQIDPESLLDTLARPQESIMPPKVEGIPFPSGQKRSWAHYAIGLVVLAFLLLVFEIYRENHVPKPPAQQLKMKPDVPAQPAPVGVLQPPAAPIVPKVAAEASQPAAPVAMPKPVPMAPAEAPKPLPAGASQPAAVPAASGPIHLVFDVASWVEVRDASGRIIFSKLNPAGSEQFVSGAAPFSLVIGNAHSVRLFYQGKPVDLAPYIKVEVARLTLK